MLPRTVFTPISIIEIRITGSGEGQNCNSAKSIVIRHEKIEPIVGIKFITKAMNPHKIGKFSLVQRQPI